MTNKIAKEENGRIQVVVPLSLQNRWESLQNSSVYSDKLNYKMVEDMVEAREIALFGATHPAYGQQLDDLDKCWSTVRNFMVRLIEETEKADENARKRVENTLRTMESELKKIPELKKERDEYSHKYYEVRIRNEELTKSLEEERARTAEAEARCKNAEAKVNDLQNRLNVANETKLNQMQEFMVKLNQMQEFMAKHSAPVEVEKAETVTHNNAASVPEAAVKGDDTSSVHPVATADNTPIAETVSPSVTDAIEPDASTVHPAVTADNAPVNEDVSPSVTDAIELDASTVHPVATANNNPIAEDVSPSLTDAVEPDATAIAETETVVPEKRRGRRKSKA